MRFQIVGVYSKPETFVTEWMVSPIAENHWTKAVVEESRRAIDSTIQFHKTRILYICLCFDLQVIFETISVLSNEARKSNGFVTQTSPV